MSYLFKKDINLIKKKLFCNIHDSEFNEILYDANEKVLRVYLYNKITAEKIAISFYEVKLYSSFAYDPWDGLNLERYISSLTLEENIDSVYLNKPPFDEKNDLYFVFQQFSGNEMHIICEGVNIQISKVR